MQHLINILGTKKDLVLQSTDGTTFQLETEATDQENQIWVQEMQDEVDRWFTLENPIGFLTANTSDAIMATCKCYLCFLKYIDIRNV